MLARLSRYQWRHTFWI